MVFFENTAPAGLLGLLITTAFVRDVTAASRASAVSSYPVDASARTGTGRALARWAIGAYDAAQHGPVQILIARRARFRRAPHHRCAKYAAMPPSVASIRTNPNRSSWTTSPTLTARRFDSARPSVPDASGITTRIGTPSQTH